MGYSESSKAYRLYFPVFKKIDISKDVTFDKYSAYIKSRKRPAEEIEAPRIHDTAMNEEIQEEDRELEEPKEPVDPPQENNPYKRKPTRVCEIIQGSEKYGASEETHRGRKRTRSCSSYVALLFDIIDKDPSKYEETIEIK